MANIEEKIEVLVIKPITKLGYELYDVQYTKEGKDFFLKIFIDKPNGIDLNDCEKVNNEINDLLDDANYIKDTYFLEVSSPGIERVLRKDKHLKSNIDNIVEIKLFNSINNKKLLQGKLRNFDDSSLIIENDEGKFEIERKNIAVIKKVYQW